MELEKKKRTYSQNLLTVGLVAWKVTDTLRSKKSQQYHHLKLMMQLCQILKFSVEPTIDGYFYSPPPPHQMQKYVSRWVVQ